MISAALWHCIRFIERYPKYSKPMSDIYLKKSLFGISQIWHNYFRRGGQIYNLCSNVSSGLMYQKLLKSVRLTELFLKNKNVAVFWDSVYAYAGILGTPSPLPPVCTLNIALPDDLHVDSTTDLQTSLEQPTLASSSAHCLNGSCRREFYIIVVAYA